MNNFNIISGVCSIIGLFVSLFVASKVWDITESNNNNSGNISLGNKTKKISKKHSVFADNNSNAALYDYSHSKIFGEIDELPVLKEKIYYISTENVDLYNLGISKDTCVLKFPPELSAFYILVDFRGVVSKPEENRWIGYSIKSLPMKDWRGFVNNNYELIFDYIRTGTIKELWIEITNCSIGKKIYKQKIDLIERERKIQISLGIFKNTIQDWKSVDEISLVFFPEDCREQFGSIVITDFYIRLQ